MPKSRQKPNKNCRCESSGLYFFIPIIVACLCPIALLAVGFTVAMPYGYVRHFSEDVSICTVQSTTWPLDKRPACDCGTDDVECEVTYPCVLVQVDYFSTQTSRQVKNATLFHLPYEYYHQNKDKCSTIHCDQNMEENVKFVQDFVRSYGAINQTFPCYPGEDSSPEALVSIIEHWKVLLGMLLPAVLFIISVTVIIGYVFWR